MRFEVKTYNQSYHTNSIVQARSMREIWEAKHGKAIIIDDDDLKSWVESERPYYEIIDTYNGLVIFTHDSGTSSLYAITEDLDTIYDQIERYLYTLNTI